MKKDIEWLKKEIAKEMLKLEHNRNKKDGDLKYQTLRSVAEKIYQLDEPEVLSHELPVIPKYVGEFIEEVKASGDRLDDAFSILRGIYHQSKTADWVAKEKRNSETFARAWLDGYEVEEEPLYYALIKGHNLIAGEDACKYWKCDMRNGSMFLSNRYSHSGRYLAEMSKNDWGKFDINDTNADFVEVTK